jgi:hypothetical protein
MFRVLAKVWWLLAICGISDAVLAVMNLLMTDPEGLPGLRLFALPNQVWNMSIVALLAGACAIAAGLFSSRKGKTWLLSLHGFALGVYGLIGLSPLVKGPLSFRLVSLLFVLMAVSLGVFSLEAAKWQQSNRRGRWFFFVSGGLTLCFALSYTAVSMNLIRFVPPPLFWTWMSLNFGLFAAITIYFAMGSKGYGISQFGSVEILPQVQNPRLAH